MDTDFETEQVKSTDDFYTYTGGQAVPKPPRHRATPQPKPAEGYPKPKGKRRA